MDVVVVVCDVVLLLINNDEVARVNWIKACCPLGNRGCPCNVPLSENRGSAGMFVWMGDGRRGDEVMVMREGGGGDGDGV